MVDRSKRESEMRRRRDMMGVLNSAEGGELRRLVDGAGLPEEAELLRGPETGLVALRGRIGGGGAPFNFGEATVTRATVRIPTGETGHAYALGRDGQKVRLAALIDALAQRQEYAGAVEDRIVAPLRRMGEERDRLRREETAATKVDFFTMVRGED